MDHNIKIRANVYYTCPTTAARGKYCLPKELFWGFFSGSSASATTAPLGESIVAVAFILNRNFNRFRFGKQVEDRIGHGFKYVNNVDD